MRYRRGRTSGISFGTIVAVLLTTAVIVGCVALFPRLMGNIEQRVDPQQVSVALDSSLRALRGDAAVEAGPIADQAAVTPPPAAMATQPPAITQTQLSTLTMTVTGAISVDTQIQKACTGADGYTFDPVFEQLAEGFQSDINLATLENLVVVNEKLTDVNMPVDALAAIHKSGINILSTGFFGGLNNGLAGLGETLEAIHAAGITPYGLYPTAESRGRVTTVVVGDVTVALLSYQNELSAAGKKKTTPEEQAFAVAPLKLPEIAADISSARAAGAQIVVVSLCWGKEGAAQPTGTQKEQAQGIADAGADLILGTHSGVVQPLRLLTAKRADGTTHQTLCAYSLGNLLESDRAQREAISGILLHIGMEYDLSADQLTFASLSYTPTYVWRGKTDGKTGYRVLRSNAEVPAFVDSEQQKVMERCLKLVRDALADSPVVEAP